MCLHLHLVLSIHLPPIGLWLLYDVQKILDQSTQFLMMNINRKSKCFDLELASHTQQLSERIFCTFTMIFPFLCSTILWYLNLFLFLFIVNHYPNLEPQLYGPFGARWVDCTNCCQLSWACCGLVCKWNYQSCCIGAYLVSTVFFNMTFLYWFIYLA